MTTAVNLLAILAFLSALYTLLGLLCAIAEHVQTQLYRRTTRRRVQPSTGRNPSRRTTRRSRTGGHRERHAASLPT
jgi:hypothetical protein